MIIQQIYILIIFTGLVFSYSQSDRKRSTSRLPKPDILERLEGQKNIIDAQFQQNKDKIIVLTKPSANDESVENSDESIEGRYRNSEETTCELLLDIFKSEDGYSYKFQIKDRLYEGDISISTVDDEKYVRLEGIPWVKYIGSLTNCDGDPDDIEGYPTYGIDLYWSDHEIVLQNTGNNMNFYVKLDCDEKFIRFVKD